MRGEIFKQALAAVDAEDARERAIKQEAQLRHQQWQVMLAAEAERALREYLERVWGQDADLLVATTSIRLAEGRDSGMATWDSGEGVIFRTYSHETYIGSGEAASRIGAFVWCPSCEKHHWVTEPLTPLEVGKVVDGRDTYHPNEDLWEKNREG